MKFWLELNFKNFGMKTSKQSHNVRFSPTVPHPIMGRAQLYINTMK